MGDALHQAVARAGAGFELDALELEDGRLVVRGWWFGVRGMRFVRPALIVDDRQVLATLEHKPWAADADGAWVAAFPWKRPRADVSGVTLVVAPSVEVPLDRESAPPAPRRAPLRRAPVAPPPEATGRTEPRTNVRELREPLRDELEAVERRLDLVREELREARTAAAEREARCRGLEQKVADERRAAQADDEVVRAHAMAVLDRDRALAQLDEAVGAREAAVRACKRSEGQRDEALAAREAAQARRDAMVVERDEARRQRDEVLLAYNALESRLNGESAQAQRGAPAQPPAAAAQTPARDASRRQGAAAIEEPLGVRRIPAARRVGAHLHRSQREREHNVTKWDMWVIRVLGSVAALSFIALLVMILQAFFVF